MTCVPDARPLRAAREVLRFVRWLLADRPLPRLARGLYRAFPYEIGYARFLMFTRLATEPPRTDATPDAGTKQLEYSQAFLTRFTPDRRIEWPMFLMAGIPDCPRDALLVVGPRYEPELLMARGLGWPAEATRGLDTFSYSPLIDVGDMHAMPYRDGEFSALVCGWTLSYSSRPEVAAREMQRVVRPGGYIAVSMQKVPDDFVEVLDEVPSGDERIQTLAQLDALYDGCRRVVGLEPDVASGEEGHTIAVYKKEQDVRE